MIMTSSQINTMAGLQGGGLVVSSSGAINKPLTNAAANMFVPGAHAQQQHQGVPQGIHRVTASAAGLHMQRAPALHLGTRLPGPTAASGLCGPPGMATNASYATYQNPGPQGLPVGKYLLDFFLGFLFSSCDFFMWKLTLASSILLVDFYSGYYRYIILGGIYYKIYVSIL